MNWITFGLMISFFFLFFMFLVIAIYFVFADNFEACGTSIWASQVELWWIKYWTSTRRGQRGYSIVRSCEKSDKFLYLFLLSSSNLDATPYPVHRQFLRTHFVEATTSWWVFSKTSNQQLWFWNIKFFYKLGYTNHLTLLTFFHSFN